MRGRCIEFALASLLVHAAGAISSFEWKGKTIEEDLDKRGTLVDDALGVLDAVEKLRRLFAVLTSRPLNFTFKSQVDEDLRAFRICSPIPSSRDGNLTYCCPRWGIKELKKEPRIDDMTWDSATARNNRLRYQETLKHDLVLRKDDHWSLTIAMHCNYSAWMKEEFDDRPIATWRSNNLGSLPTPGDAADTSGWRMETADLYPTLGDGSELGAVLGMARFHSKYSDEMMDTVSKIITYFPQRSVEMAQVAYDYKEGLASSIWWDGITFDAFKLQAKRSHDSIAENQYRMEIYGWLFRVIVLVACLLFFMVVRVQRRQRVRTLRGYVEDLSSTAEEQQHQAEDLLLHTHARQQRIDQGGLLRANSAWRRSISIFATASTAAAVVAQPVVESLRMVTVPPRPLKEFFEIPMRYFLLDILCCGCCRLRRVPPSLRAHHPNGPPRTIAGRVSEWVRSHHVWVLVDTHSSRVRWPLLSALHMTLVLRRTWGLYWDIQNSKNPKEECCNGLIAKAFMDSGLSFDACLYFDYLFRCMVEFVRDSLLFAGNSSVHSSAWLLVGFILECVFAYHDYLIDEARIKKSKDTDEFGSRTMDIMDSIVGVMLHVVVAIAFLRLWIEEYRKLPGHLSEVEKASFLYVRHRLLDEKKQVGYRCKLCLPNLTEAQREDLISRCELCQKRRAAGDERLCGEELMSPMEEARHWQGHHCGKQPTTRWTEPLEPVPPKGKVAHELMEILRDAFLPGKKKDRFIAAPRATAPRNPLRAPVASAHTVSPDVALAAAHGTVPLPLARGHVVPTASSSGVGQVLPRGAVPLPVAHGHVVEAPEPAAESGGGGWFSGWGYGEAAGADAGATASEVQHEATAGCVASPSNAMILASTDGVHTNHSGGVHRMASLPEQLGTSFDAGDSHPAVQGRVVRIHEGDPKSDCHVTQSEVTHAADKRRRLPIFMSTLLLLSVIPSAIMLRPSIVKDIMDAYNYWSWSADILTFGDSFWMIVGGVNKTQAAELRLIGQNLSKLTGGAFSDTTTASIAVTKFLTTLNPDKMPILLPLAGMVHCCGGRMAGMRKVAPACENQTVEIVMGLSDFSKLIPGKPDAQDAARWLAQRDTDKAFQNYGGEPPGATAIKEALIMQEHRGKAGHTCHVYAYELMNSMLGTWDDGIRQPTSDQNISHGQEALAFKNDEGDLVVLDIWRTLEPEQFANASRRLTLLLGDGGQEATAAAIHGAIQGLLPGYLQPVFEPLLIVAIQQIKYRANNVSQTVNDTIAFRNQFIYHRDVILYRALPIVFWGTVVGKALGTIYVMFLLKWIVDSYCKRYAESALAEEHREDALPRHHNVGSAGMYEATVFPGYVLSTCYLSFKWLEFWTKFWFAFAALMTIDSIREAFVEWVWNQLKIFLFSWVLNKFILAKLLFSKILVDSGGEIRHPVVYSLMFPAFVICNFVVGVYSGVTRAIIGICFLMVKISRCDQLCIPVEWQNSFGLDWAYGSFLSVVAMAEREYHPIKRMALKSFGGDQIYDSWIFLATKDQPASVMADVAERQRKARTRNRWHLYLTLIRNPMLMLERKHRLKPPPPPQEDRGCCCRICGCLAHGTAGLCGLLCCRCCGVGGAGAAGGTSSTGASPSTDLDTLVQGGSTAGMEMATYAMTATTTFMLETVDGMSA